MVRHEVHTVYARNFLAISVVTILLALLTASLVILFVCLLIITLVNHSNITSKRGDVTLSYEPGKGRVDVEYREQDLHAWHPNSIPAAGLDHETYDRLVISRRLRW